MPHEAMPHEAMGGGSSRAQVAWHAGAALVALALELAIVLLLFFSHDGRAAAPRIFALFGSTRSSMADLVVLDVAKAMLVLLGGLVAAHLGRISASDVEGPAAGADGGASEPLPSADDVIVQPLLLPGAGGRAHTSSSSAPAPVAGAARNGTPSAAAPAAYGVLPGGTREPHAGPSAPPPAHPAAAAEPGQALSFDAKNRANARRQGMVGAVFLVSTAFQMFVGIKTIQFDFVAAREREDGALLGILVLLTNVSTWFVVRAVREATKEDGFVVPEFHPHALYHRTNLALHHCDLCSERGTTFFSCRQCGFDVCPRCFARKDKRTSEGLLRNDRGFQEPAEFTTWQYVTRTASLVRGHVPLFLVAIGCLVATTLAQLFLPNYQGAILDAIVQSDVHGFKEAIVIYLGISVASGLLNAVRSLCFNVAMRQIGMSLRKALFAQIIAQDMVFFDSMKTGDLISRLSGNIGAMLSPLQSTLQTLLSNLILLVGSLVMCFVISWRLSMLAFTTLAPIVYMTSAYARWSRRQNYMIWQTLGDANADAAEVITNMRLVRAFSTEAAEKAKYAHKCDISLQKGMLDALYGTLTVTLGDYLDQGASVIILWCGGATAMVAGSNLSVGRLITYSLYYNRIQNSYNSLNGVLNSFTRSAGAAMRVLSLFDLSPAIGSTDETGVPLPGGPRDAVSVRFENVGFYYQMRPDRKVLDALSLEVPAGTVTALVGKSGAGKSTLAGILLRFYDVKDGRVVINGVDLRSLQLASFHAALGVVTQDTQLFNTSIEENITYGLASYTQEKLEQAARQAQAHDFIMALPDGYRTRVGERGTRLSGGQKQRIAICRALLRSPRLLVLDEATSSLDATAEAEVQASLDALIWTGEHTVILIAHRLSTVVNATQIALLEGGAVAELGTHAELVARGERYAELVSKQLQQQRDHLPK